RLEGAAVVPFLEGLPERLHPPLLGDVGEADADPRLVALVHHLPEALDVLRLEVAVDEGHRPDTLGRRPADVPQQRHRRLGGDQLRAPAASSLLRSILPRSFLGRERTNSTERGYLNGASRDFTKSCSSRASVTSPAPSRHTTYAFGLISPSRSLYPITAHSA